MSASAIAIAKILDLGITLYVAGIERQSIVDKVRGMEDQGATPDEISDALQKMRQDSEGAAQRAIEGAKP